MDQAKSAILQTMKTNNFVVSKGLENLTDDHFFERPNDSSNPIHFILGHITVYRYYACKLLGDDSTYKYTDLYDMGKKVQERSTYPSSDEIKLEWEAVSKKLEALLNKAEAEILQKEHTNKAPIGDQNILGALQFLMYHESYHVGQISILTRYFGYDPIIG